MNIEQYYKYLIKKLKKNSNNTAELDARLLICHYLNINLTNFLLNQHINITKNKLIQLKIAEKLIESHMPISRILKYREFWGIKFIINSYVFDPREDSEILIESLLHFIPPSNKSLKLLDLGTGSGCLLLSLLNEYKTSTGIGVDYSKNILEIANKNAMNLKLNNRCKFIKSNWFDNLTPQKFDIIISNPPYIPSIKIKKLDNNVKLYDPLKSLDGGKYGVDPYNIIIKNSINYLKPNGILIFEIGLNQDYILFKLLKKNNFYSDKFYMQQIISQQQFNNSKNGLGYDLKGNPRIIISKYKINK